MAQNEPSFTIGVEEEYLLVDKETRNLATDPPKALMEACEKKLAKQVSPEFLRCQIEVGTTVCKSVQEARSELAHLRGTIADISGEHGLAPIAASTHPFARWKEQQHTDKERYNDLARDMQVVVRRMLICGMHVHVGIEDDEQRVDYLNQFPYFLPHLLALSTSSPFWKGDDTGLCSYRLTVFDNLPRTGLPPRFTSFSEYERSVNILTENALIEDTTKIWWDLRPSARFPTLEMRITDVMPRLHDVLAVAALTQSIMRMLWRLRTNNQRWRIYDRFLVGENRWRAQRYGMSRDLIDLGSGTLKPYGELLAELIDLTRQDAEVLGCLDELNSAADILKTGTSADRQRAVYQAALDSGADRDEALREVARSLVAEFGEVPG